MEFLNQNIETIIKLANEEINTLKNELDKIENNFPKNFEQYKESLLKITNLIERLNIPKEKLNELDKSARSLLTKIFRSL